MAAVLVATLAGLPGAARADLPLQVKLYGFLNGEVERVWGTGGATAYAGRGRVTDGNSRLGVTTSYDVAPRTRAVLQIEGQLNFDSGGTSDQGTPALLTSRNSFVGVEHEWVGRLVVGNVDSAYRSLVGSGGALGGNLGLTVLGLDLWNNTTAQMSGNAWSPFSRGEARYRNSVHYGSPDWALADKLLKVRVAGSYAFDEAVGNGLRRDRWSLAAKVSALGVDLGVGYDRQKNTGVDTDRLEQGYGMGLTGLDGVHTDFVKVVAGYALPVTRTYVGAGLERASYGYAQFTPPSGGAYLAPLAKGTMKQTGWMVSLAQPVGPATLMGSCAKLGELSGAVLDAGSAYEATQYSVGAKWTFTDAFTVYAYYTEIRNEAQQTVNLGQGPIFSNDLGSAGAFLSPGTSPSAFGLGAIARF